MPKINVGPYQIGVLQQGFRDFQNYNGAYLSQCSFISFEARGTVLTQPFAGNKCLW